MTRNMILVAALVALLLIVAFFFLVWLPKQNEIAEVRDEIETVQQQTRQLEARIDELEQARQNAPELEAEVVAAETIVPRDLALPSALRQLQTAADDSGVVLSQITASEPQPVAEAPEGLAAIQVNIAVAGGYFQIVDFLRRVEDPAISPRGFLWDTFSLAPEEYPTLSASVSGRMFALLPVAPEAEPEPPAEEEEAEEADVEVDVEALGATGGGR